MSPSFVIENGTSAALTLRRIGLLARSESTGSKLVAESTPDVVIAAGARHEERVLWALDASPNEVLGVGVSVVFHFASDDGEREIEIPFERVG
jgi:hypothetical protein